MNKISLCNLDTDVFYEKLENGLEIFLSPKKNVNNIYVTYSTKYGSDYNEFIPLNKNEYTKVPLGIAHFLEHKMFEQEDKTDVMAYFSERGSDCNANTNHKKTTYLFSGPSFFEENLSFLMEYVEKPYFTDENVNKEKGIIEQEIKMYQDRPYTKMYEGIIYNSFVEHPMKYPIIGTIDSINSITVEDLYNCYNTFYHPSNMFIVITGNIDTEKTLDIIKKHQQSRNIKDAKPIVIKNCNEPDKVSKKREEITMNITIPKICISYKINKNKFKTLDNMKIIPYIGTIFDLKLGATSLLNEQLKKEEIITYNIGVSTVQTDNHVLVIIAAESKHPQTLIDRIEKELTNLSINETDLERRKKVFISNNIYMSDNIFSLNSAIMNDMIKYNKLIDNDIEIFKSFNIKELNYVIKNITLEHQSIFIINPENI